MLNIDPDLFTVVVRFEVPPESQKAFVDELVVTVERTIATLPGFRSATFYASEDGTTVLNLAQWDSREKYDAAMESDAAAQSGVPEVVERHGAHEAHLDAYRVGRALDGSTPNRRGGPGPMEPAIDPEVWAALRESRVILTPTHSRPSAGTQTATAVATRLAAQTGAALFLSDRSATTWADTPHVEVLELEALRAGGASTAELADKVVAAQDAGVGRVAAVRPSMPDLEGLEAALDATGADTVVVFEDPDHVGLLLRMELRGDPISALRARIGARALVVVSADGRARLLS